MTERQWEIHAAYGGLSAGDLGRIMGDRRLNPYTQAQLLSSALAMPFKETGRAHYRALIEDEAGHRAYEAKQIREGMGWLERLVLEPSPCDALPALPRYSFALDLHFELMRPYLSRDDDAFYVIDNPVRKEKVFKVPFVASTSWKGSLRTAATQRLLIDVGRLLPEKMPEDENECAELLGWLWKERAQRVLLFGNEKRTDSEFINGWLAERVMISRGDENESDHCGRLHDEAQRLGRTFEKYLKENHYRTEKVDGRQGRLFFFPTYFGKIGLEIINPHDRRRRVGKNPILFECVPAGAVGRFRLLYVPYDSSGRVTPDEATLQAQLTAHLPLVADAVRDLLCVYGFGAKTSSGFGSADPERVAGELRLNVLRDTGSDEAGVSESAVRRLLMGDPLEHRLHDEFFVAGKFVTVPDDEIRDQAWPGMVKADYRKVNLRVLDFLAERPTGPRRLSASVTHLDQLPGHARELVENIGDGP